MSDAPSPLADLLAECDALGIRLLLANDGALDIDAPRSALSPDLLERLRARRLDILLVLYADQDSVSADEFPYEWEWLEASGLPPDALCRCGSTTWRDIPIHDGQSVRRDCAVCGRFIDFPIWYGKGTGQIDKCPV
jgi:hypothetical protein